MDMSSEHNHTTSLSGSWLPQLSVNARPLRTPGSSTIASCRSWGRCRVGTGDVGVSLCQGIAPRRCLSRCLQFLSPQKRRRDIRTKVIRNGREASFTSLPLLTPLIVSFEGFNKPIAAWKHTPDPGNILEAFQFGILRLSDADLPPLLGNAVPLMTLLRARCNAHHRANSHTQHEQQRGPASGAN